MIIDNSILVGIPPIKIIHYSVSALFLIVALLSLFRSGRGFIKNIDYTNFDKILSYIFLINLYLQLILGLILFSNLGSLSGYEYLSANSGIKAVDKRLWPIEHIVLMVFALFIANLGLILSLKSQTDKAKHKRIFYYFLSSIILISISLGAMYLV